MQAASNLIMDAFVSDFSHFWLAEQSSAADLPEVRGTPDDEPLSDSLQEALEALADRINAARSVV
jgi:hypothetical protein